MSRDLSVKTEPPSPLGEDVAKGYLVISCRSQDEIQCGLQEVRKSQQRKEKATT